ncbi:MAG: hypothetical protein OEV62_08555 [Actinomycetota bacterium]|nr:hypothetical protein [Actinomycetota bacterium]MDH5278918.1 hypothetical protein [Actinomycetota bacterium]
MTDNQTPPATPPEEPAVTVESDPVTATVHTPDGASAPVAPVAQAAAASPDHTRRNLWLASGAGAVVAGVALGGVAFGATVLDRHDERSVSFQRNAPFSGSSFGQDDHHGPGDRMLGGPMRGGPLGGFSREGALHGEVVFQDASGDYVTLTMQRGEVTAVSGTSVSLDSADGFSATYAIDDQTRAVSPDADPVTDGMTGIEVGDTVNVVATATDGAGTAQLVLEGDFGPGNLPGFGPNGPEAA